MLRVSKLLHLIYFRYSVTLSLPIYLQTKTINYLLFASMDNDSYCLIYKKNYDKGNGQR